MNAKDNIAQAWMMGILSWLVPGSGHILQGRWQRGILLGGAVCAMFCTGLLLGGHLFTFGQQEPRQGTPALLQIPPMIANLGTGVLYLICWATNTGLAEQAKRATYEYGNTFLWVAGLLNFLSMLDAFDIGAKRKQ
jgi:hypothetical protein